MGLQGRAGAAGLARGGEQATQTMLHAYQWWKNFQLQQQGLELRKQYNDLYQQRNNWMMRNELGLDPEMAKAVADAFAATPAQQRLDVPASSKTPAGLVDFVQPAQPAQPAAGAVALGTAAGAGSEDTPPAADK